MKYVFILCSVLFFYGCSSKSPKTKPTKEQIEKAIKVVYVDEKKDKPLVIEDLVEIPQDANYYIKAMAEDKRDLSKIEKEYEKNYFSPWDNSSKKSDYDKWWVFKSYKANSSYGENLQPLKQEFFDDMVKKCDFENYSNLGVYAITTQPVSIRAFPTIKPLLRDPKLAGEGFPFDYLQNSTIHANKPIIIRHFSKDRAWVYVESSFTSGWIKTSQVVVLRKEYVKMWKKAQQIFLIKENVPLYDKDGNFLFYSKIGMMLALISEDKSSYTALAVSSLKDNEPLFKRVKISKEIARKNISKLDKELMASIMKEIMKSNYGWGGLYGQRDCSSTMRDMFAPFGIWLPRNSSKQSKIGRVISLENISDEQKIETIKNYGIPFKTLLYKKGHIVLYVGVYKGKIVIFHNTWGVKTKKDGKEGRVVVGKTIFSTLRLGKNLRYYDEEAEMLRNLKSMNILTH